MVTIDAIGVPIPIDHPEFRNDLKLLKKISQLESFIELKHDMEDAKQALKALRFSRKQENLQSITSLFDCIPWMIPESILSYIVVLYGKAFTESTGRTRLDCQVHKIFKKDIDKHQIIIDLRNGFYAHHGIEANRHQLFCLIDNSNSGKVRLNPSGQTTRILMSTWANLEIIDFCISKVGEYLNVRIDGLCRSIENDFSAEQLKILTKTPKEELFKKHWRENTENRINIFSTRKT